MKQLFSFLLIYLLTGLANAQEPGDSLKTQRLDPVVISSTRFENAPADAPFSVSIINTNRLQLGTQQLSLTESLSAVPGVVALNPDNFAQDLRISIRGFGARSAFGIRGIRVLVDGLPESTPDGQADVDNLDLSAIQSLEILRGAASGLYGNAAGGVLSFQTEEPTKKASLGLNTTFGSFGFQKYSAKTGFTLGRLGAHLSVTHNRTEGFREHSRMNQTIVNGKFRYQISSAAKLTLILNVGSSPLAEDAGGLTSEQITENRRQARPQNIQFNAGESVNQQKYGAIFEKRWSEKHQLKVMAFAVFRQFSSRLAFQSSGYVAFNRQFKGVSATYIFTGKKWRTQIGLEADDQLDKRQRYDNLNGTKGLLSLDQGENFRSLAAFWLNEIHLTKKIKWSTGLRADRIRLAASDHFLSDGDQSGSRNIARLNPSLGITGRINTGINLFANVNSSYETPTLNELSANPNGLGGFNNALKPQSALSFETGARGRLSKFLQYELALFQILLHDEFVPFQLAQQPGRTFYKNAGKSERKGIEIALNGSIFTGLSYAFSYTFSQFKYTDYESTGIRFDGNQQPGIPKHLVFTELRWQHPHGIFAVTQAQYSSAFFADDGNNISESKRCLLNIRMGYSGKTKQLRIEPFFGINNLLSTIYNGNILINAMGGRYFEPSSGAYFFGGLKLDVAPTFSWR